MTETILLCTQCSTHLLTSSSASQHIDASFYLSTFVEEKDFLDENLDGENSFLKYLTHLLTWWKWKHFRATFSLDSQSGQIWSAFKNL